MVAVNVVKVYQELAPGELGKQAAQGPEVVVNGF
jgi:hypothetical protein